jgi:hypothetical protein
MIQRTIPPALFIALSMAITTPALAAGPVKNVTINAENLARLSPQDQTRALAIRDRLEAITAMDRGAMDRADKKAVRAEVRSLKAEAEALNQRAGGTVVYISTAGLIIIILLLIILL